MTGKNPANQSETGGLQGGDTINTSQGGGTTTIGVNNQMFDPGEGAYFTFVKGMPTTTSCPTWIRTRPMSKPTSTSKVSPRI